jgi:hypothetical protein
MKNLQQSTIHELIKEIRIPKLPAEARQIYD